jgi:hypothetical protein
MGPYSALWGLIRFHETGGHEGDGSDAALVRAKAELAAAPLMPVQASPCTADAWPGEAELREMASGVCEGRPLASRFGVALEMARRLRAHMTAVSKPAEPEWIEWHGGECPVPAGTRVEVKTRRGEESIWLAGELDDWHHATLEEQEPDGDIIAYRILGADQ